MNVRGRDPKALKADPNFVYVGRAVGRAGWKESPWANPFRVAQTKGNNDLNPQSDRCRTADEAVSRFADYFERGGLAKSPNNFILRDHVSELRGKTLGCWCCDWNGTGEPEKPCHAVVLARLAEGSDRP